MDALALEQLEAERDREATVDELVAFLNSSACAGWTRGGDAHTHPAVTVKTSAVAAVTNGITTTSSSAVPVTDILRGTNGEVEWGGDNGSCYYLTMDDAHRLVFRQCPLRWLLCGQALCRSRCAMSARRCARVTVAPEVSVSPWPIPPSSPTPCDSMALHLARSAGRTNCGGTPSASRSHPTRVSSRRSTSDSGWGWARAAVVGIRVIAVIIVGVR